MKRIVKHKNDCCGCTACENICPKGAISMKPDALGFMYPRIDETLCIDCGLCAKVCQFKEDYNYFNESEPQVYAFRINDEKQLMKSQSGGAFWAFARKFIMSGGIVYGVGLDNSFKAIHKRVDNLTDLEGLRGSKYVQSDVGDTFKLAKEDLKNGQKVMFSGTSCQIAGLRSFIGKRLGENLFTIDLICHGVPSPYIWRDYLSSIEKKYKKRIQSANFRDKTKGWTVYVQSFKIGNIKIFNNDYARIFGTDFLRENCYECPYTNINRVSDITISDFWGWPKSSDLYKDNKGLSMLLINSQKGQMILDSVIEESKVIKSDLNSCRQPHLHRPTVRNPLRTQFENDYIKYSYNYVAKKYFGLGFKDVFIRNLKTFIKKILKK